MEEVKNEAQDPERPVLWYADELEPMIKVTFSETVSEICADHCEGHVDGITAMENIVGAKNIVDRLLAKIR